MLPVPQLRCAFQRLILPLAENLEQKKSAELANLGRTSVEPVLGVAKRWPRVLVLYLPPEDPQASRECFENTHIPLAAKLPGQRTCATALR